MFPGIKLTIAGKECVIPALTLGALRNGVKEMLAEHDALAQDTTKLFEAFQVRADIIYRALVRNHPDVSHEQLLDALDLNNISPIWSTVLGASGLKVGEAPAAVTTTTVTDQAQSGT